METLSKQQDCISSKDRGHSVSDMSVIIIEKISSNNQNFRKEREKMYINKMETKYKGMNRKT
jgi:hypothetical protein